METPGIRRLLRQTEPRTLRDLAQTLAVTRPGALAGKETYLRRRRGLEPVRYLHALAEPVLRDTLGLLVFDDDALALVEALTGLPVAEAGFLRHQLNDKETAEAALPGFLRACERQSVPRAAALEAAKMLSQDAYSFCKSHAVALASIAWQEASLKARHPVAFWVAALNHHQSRYPRRVYVEAIKRAGVAILLPCLNRSAKDFTQEGVGIRVGLGAIRSLGGAALEAILDDRQKGGPFNSLAELRRRLQLTPQDLGLLIRAGALDFTGRGRDAMLREADALRLGRVPARWRGEEDLEPWPLEGLLTHPLDSQRRAEWELLGFCAGPQLMALLRPVLALDLADSRGLVSRSGQKVRLAGLVALERDLGKREPGHLLILEDEYGAVEVEALPGKDIPPDPSILGPIVVAEGKVEDRFGAAVLITDRLERPLPGGTAPTSTGTSSKPPVNRVESIKPVPVNGIKSSNK